jgi:hypothetical protein
MPNWRLDERQESTVQIDLHNPEEFTEAAVRQLLAAGQPGVHNQLRVSNQGIAWLSTGVIGGMQLEGLRFRFETWAAGSGYVGPEAAADEAWVRQVFNALRHHWENPGQDYIDIY